MREAANDELGPEVVRTPTPEGRSMGFCKSSTNSSPYRTEMDQGRRWRWAGQTAHASSSWACVPGGPFTRGTSRSRTAWRFLTRVDAASSLRVSLPFCFSPPPKPSMTTTVLASPIFSIAGGRERVWGWMPSRVPSRIQRHDTVCKRTSPDHAKSFLSQGLPFHLPPAPSRDLALYPDSAGASHSSAPPSWSPQTPSHSP